VSHSGPDVATLRDRRDTRNRARDELKATRQRLTEVDGVRPELSYDLQTIFIRNEQSAAATIWVMAAFFAFASMFWAPRLQGALWLVLVIGTKVLLLELGRRFLQMPREAADPVVWHRRFWMAELLCGVTWAGFALVGVGSATEISGASGQFPSHVFIFATLIVLLAIRMTFASTVISIFYAGTVPMTIAVVGRLLLLNDAFYTALALLAVGVHVYFVFLAKGLHATAVQMLEFRAQKDQLIAELAEAKLVSDEARRRAEGANKAKSRFLATMSHELRTPLNAIMGFSEVMKTELMGPLNNPTYKDYAGNIHDSGKHLLNLINEILDLSRIEAGKFELHEEPVHLTDVAEDSVKLLQLKANSKGLEIIENYEPMLAQAWVDQRAMRQITLNLISNALKFTPKGGRITVTVETDVDGGQLISVRDTGPGIPADEIPRVLQAFGQGSLAHETAEGGTGLGLPIVQNLIELHGGTFELLSELRKGTEAIVRVPKTRVLNRVEAVKSGPGAAKPALAPTPVSSRQSRLKPGSPRRGSMVAHG
jgi:two-component system, cell cycle sensor histidine kinase PleC